MPDPIVPEQPEGTPPDAFGSLNVIGYKNGSADIVLQVGSALEHALALANYKAQIESLTLVTASLLIGRVRHRLGISLNEVKQKGIIATNDVLRAGSLGADDPDFMADIRIANEKPLPR